MLSDNQLRAHVDAAAKHAHQQIVAEFGITRDELQRLFLVIDAVADAVNSAAAGGNEHDVNRKCQLVAGMAVIVLRDQLQPTGHIDQLLMDLANRLGFDNVSDSLTRHAGRVALFLWQSFADFPDDRKLKLAAAAGVMNQRAYEDVGEFLKSGGDSKEQIRRVYGV